MIWLIKIWGLIGAILCGATLTSKDCGWGKKENGGWLFNIISTILLWPFSFLLLGVYILLLWLNEHFYWVWPRRRKR